MLSKVAELTCLKSVIFYILKYYLILNPTPPTCVDLFEGATGPDVVQTVWTLRGASADVRKDGRREEGGQFFFPQALHLRAVGSHAKVTQHQQLSLTYISNTNREILSVGVIFGCIYVFSPC